MIDIREAIEVRYKTVGWGPIPVDLGDLLPDGAMLSAVTVRGFVGKLRPEDNIEDFSEITSELINLPIVIADGRIVLLKLNYPSVDFQNRKATLVFETELSGGGANSFYLYHIKIGGAPLVRDQFLHSSGGVVLTDSKGRLLSSSRRS